MRASRGTGAASSDAACRPLFSPILPKVRRDETGVRDASHPKKRVLLLLRLRGAHLGRRRGRGEEGFPGRNMSDLAAAKAQLAFAELTGGVKFSGRKHGRDMAVFSRKNTSQQNGVGGGGGTAGSRAGDPPATRGHAGASASGRAHHVPVGTGSKKSKKGKASTGRTPPTGRTSAAATTTPTARATSTSSAAPRRGRAKAPTLRIRRRRSDASPRFRRPRTRRRRTWVRGPRRRRPRTSSARRTRFASPAATNSCPPPLGDVRRPANRARTRAQDARAASRGGVSRTHADPEAGDTHPVGGASFSRWRRRGRARRSRFYSRW